MPLKSVMKRMITANGNSVFDLSVQSPVLLVFLRHFGCVFCREAMTDLAELKEQIANRNVKLVFVHMSPNEVAAQFFEQFNLADQDHISDPNCENYASFGLTKGSFTQLSGLRTITRGFEVAIKKGILPNVKFIGDGFQMPGVFLIKEGQIINSYIHRHASDKPDYMSFL